MRFTFQIVYKVMVVLICALGASYAGKTVEITEKDPEVARLLVVLKNQRVDYYADETRLVISERLSEIGSIENLKLFVGITPVNDRYTLAWIRENVILVDALLRQNTDGSVAAADEIVRRLLSLEFEQVQKCEISGDRLVALQTPGGREAAYPPPPEEAAQLLQGRLERMTELVKTQFIEQQKIVANRLASIALMTGGIKKLLTVMEEFPDPNIKHIFETQAMRAISSDK